MQDLLECGHVESPHSDFTRGYGTDNDGKRHCYECCAAQDRAYMRENGRIALYLVQTKVKVGSGAIRNGTYKITNWPNSLSFPVSAINKGRHNIAGTRYDVWFKADGHIWHGVQYGENTQICHCKRTKETAPH